MALVAFSSVAVEWSRVFAAKISVGKSRGLDGPVSLWLDFPGEPIEVHLMTRQDTTRAVAKLDKDGERLKSAGLFRYELARILHIDMPDSSKAGTILFELRENESHSIKVDPENIEMILRSHDH